jgi:hypothetical protein
MKILMLIAMLVLAGCANCVDIKTWAGTKPCDPLKHTQVAHSIKIFGINFPAFAPMHYELIDGDFRQTSKGCDIPLTNIDFGSLVEKE